MTYCVGILVKEGLTMIADTRTNAGLDNVSQYKKLHIFERPGDRMITIASAGNLAITQAVLSFLSEGIENPETGQVETIWTQPSMFKAAQLVGRAIREVYRIDGPSLEKSNAGFEITMLLGGQVAKGRLRLFMIYRQGNFIEATEDTPFLQIGEHKYGKPILDRAITFSTSITEALKLGLISMDSTMRSNLGVGMPIDLITIKRDAIAHDVLHRIEPGEPYFHDLRERWSAALRAAHKAIPTPPYGG
ncbi:peptidase [Oryzibacter oryziterrae]|uniref:peptidase n=1 Tax=Oryzibacter oryziterrae TaxID=2766474 RepID=UPI001F3B9808|nr:peptidase [Oryzibacter oryziterrae]